MYFNSAFPTPQNIKWKNKGSGNYMPYFIEKKLNMLRKIANGYWWVSFWILTKNRERMLKDTFDHLKKNSRN